MTGRIEILLSTIGIGIMIAAVGRPCLQALLLSLANCLPGHGECPCACMISQLDFGRIATQIVFAQPHNFGIGMALEIPFLSPGPGSVASSGELHPIDRGMTSAEIDSRALPRLIQRRKQIVQDLREEDCPGGNAERSPP